MSFAALFKFPAAENVTGMQHRRTSRLIARLISNLHQFRDNATSHCRYSNSFDLCAQGFSKKAQSLKLMDKHQFAENVVNKRKLVKKNTSSCNHGQLQQRTAAFHRGYQDSDLRLMRTWSKLYFIFFHVIGDCLLSQSESENHKQEKKKRRKKEAHKRTSRISYKNVSASLIIIQSCYFDYRMKNLPHVLTARSAFRALFT